MLTASHTTHPHPSPPLEREGEYSFSPFKGEMERGMGGIQMSILL